jgi:hypothetical protein
VTDNFFLKDFLFLSLENVPSQINFAVVNI